MNPYTIGTIIGLAVVLLIACIDGIANGAERDGDTVWVVVACPHRPPAEGPACGEPLPPMETKTDCTIAIERIKEPTKFRLMCAQVDRNRR